MLLLTLLTVTSRSCLPFPLSRCTDCIFPKCCIVTWSKNVKIKLFRTINSYFFVAFYGCETWSLTLREKCRSKVLENRVLKRIFGPKRD
jgi:hypothetical protein